MSLRRNFPLLFGVFLIAASTLMLEIALMRVFSVSLWYQFGFMIISTALLGFGASGTYLAVRKGALTGDLRWKLTRNALLFSISILVAFAIMIRIPLDPLKPLLPETTNPNAATVELIVYMMLYYAIIIVPFFFAGLALGTALSAWAWQIGVVYFADLVGAGLGALGVVLALYLLPGQGVVVLAAIGAALSALAFSRNRHASGPTDGGVDTGNASDPPRARISWLLALYALVLAVLVLPQAEQLFPLYIPPSKPLHIAFDKQTYPDLQLEYTGWTPFSRIDVMWQPGMKGQAWGLSGRVQGRVAGTALHRHRRRRNDRDQRVGRRSREPGLGQRVTQQPGLSTHRAAECPIDRARRRCRCAGRLAQRRPAHHRSGDQPADRRPDARQIQGVLRRSLQRHP